MYACITQEKMQIDVEIKLYRHVDMEKTCQPQH